MALMLVLVGCGARTPLGTVVSTQAETCTPTPPSCDHWTLGADHLIESNVVSVGSAVSTDCGVLISWQGGTSSWKTTLLAPDGSRTSEPDHTVLESASAPLWLARRGTRVGAALDDRGCSFVPLDVRGASTGAVVETAGSCSDLAATADGFSSLSREQGGVLVDLDSTGALTSRVSLNVPSTRAAWSRAVLDDGTFVLGSFSEDPATVVYTTWLRHFDAKGAPLADEVVVDSKVAPVHIAASSSGLLVAWQWSALEVLPTNRDGVEVGPRVDVPMSGPPYGLSLTSLPNGDVMALSVELASNEYSVTAHQLSPTGTPRAPGSKLPFHPVEPRDLAAVVGPNGDVLIVYSDVTTRDLHVQSMTCVR